jgi:hypothetical protein
VRLHIPSVGEGEPFAHWRAARIEQANCPFQFETDAQPKMRKAVKWAFAMRCSAQNTYSGHYIGWYGNVVSAALLTTSPLIVIYPLKAG